MGHFRVLTCFCFKTSPCTKRFLWKWVWFAWKWTSRWNKFSYEWFCTKTRFDNEANGNSELAYSMQGYRTFLKYLQDMNALSLLSLCFCRLAIKACLVMTPLLGITWLFGLLTPLHKAFIYIFTILDSTQVSYLCPFKLFFNYYLFNYYQLNYSIW